MAARKRKEPTVDPKITLSQLVKITDESVKRYLPEAVRYAIDQQVHVLEAKIKEEMANRQKVEIRQTAHEIDSFPSWDGAQYASYGGLTPVGGGFTLVPPPLSPANGACPDCRDCGCAKRHLLDALRIAQLEMLKGVRQFTP